MLVEEKLKSRPDLLALAASLFYLMEHCPNDPVSTPQQKVDRFNGILSTLEFDVWANGVHSGDCTKTCHTCHRCLVEDYAEQAEEILNDLKALGYELRRSQCSSS